ncbi:MAG: ferredoxin [Myxococcales bacterium]|nr:ferredoxin [Myxococcales bacterium]
MKIVVDRDLCEGNARCVKIAPQVFHTDDDDKLVILVERPPAELHEAVRKAAARCPRQALSILESD